MAKTCVKFKPIEKGSEAHNFRLKDNLPHTFKDHKYLNEYFGLSELLNMKKSICSVRKEIEKRYIETVGQKMQKKATPIREGIIVIDENTTMDDLKLFSARLNNKFGIVVFQIAIHKDEGHIDRKTGKLKKNLHAHIVCDFTDQTTGKSLKLDKNDMADIQTLAAKTLNMERGKHGTKGGLDMFEYKIAKKDEEFCELKKEILLQSHTIESVKAIEDEIKDVQYGRIDGAGKKHFFSFLERLELWFGNYIKLQQYTFWKTGEFFETAFAIFDKAEKKIKVQGKEPMHTQEQKNENRQIGMGNFQKSKQFKL